MTATPSPAAIEAIGPVAHSGTRRGWPASMALGVVVAAAFLANGREIGAFDTIPATLLPLSIVRGDGLHLDRFRPLLRKWGASLPGFVAESGGHILPSYPVGPALVALPLIAPQIMITRSGWASLSRVPKPVPRKLPAPDPIRMRPSENAARQPW